MYFFIIHLGPTWADFLLWLISEFTLFSCHIHALGILTAYVHKDLPQEPTDFPLHHMITYVISEDPHPLHWILRNDYHHLMTKGISPECTLHPIVLHQPNVYYVASSSLFIFFLLSLLLPFTIAHSYSLNMSSKRPLFISTPLMASSSNPDMWFHKTSSSYTEIENLVIRATFSIPKDHSIQIPRPSQQSHISSTRYIDFLPTIW